MNSFEQTSISAILKWSRLNNELTLANVSKKSGLSLQYIAELERGEKQPTPSAVNILCEIYDIEINLDENKKNEGEERLKNFINMLSSFLFKEISVNESVLYEKSFSYGFLYDLLILKVKHAFFDQNYREYNEFEKTFGEKYETLSGMIQKVYLFLQSLYYSYKNESIALDYAEKSIEGSENAKALLKINYASLLEKEGSFIEAIKQYDESIIDAQQYGFFTLMLLSKMNEALVLLQLRQFSDGIKILKVCIKTAEMNQNDEIIEKCKVNIVYALLLKNSFEEAEEYCVHNLKLNHPIRNFTEKIKRIYFEEDFADCKNSAENKEYHKLYKLMEETFFNLNENTIDKCIKELKNDYTFYTLYMNYCIFLLKNRGEDKDALILLAKLTNYQFLSRKNN